MKPVNFLIITVFYIHSIFAQKTTVNEYLSIDKKALQLPDSLTKTTEDIAKYINTNFISDKDKARAIFIWVASNIQYDVENMFAINFYEKREDKILKPLKTRKGICENYASLFTDICLKSGLKSYVVEGYTKQNGFADNLPHAWSAAKIDSSWFLFDPTWGSGYLSNGKFVKKINNDYFKVSPSSIIKSHIPFDYLWQFLNYPVTNQEFYEGRTQINKSRSYFNFVDSIQVYETQDHIAQLTSSAYRIEKNGLKNSLVFDRLQHIKLELENEKQTKKINLYNSSVSDYNEGINRLNDFIKYRNRQFTPNKSDPEIQNMLDEPDKKLKEAKTKLALIDSPDINLSNMIRQLTGSIDQAADQLKEQQAWLKAYLSKGKAGRKSTFYKVTWFGVPLN